MTHTLAQLATKDLFARKGKLVTGVLALIIGVTTCLLLLSIVLSAKNLATSTLSSSISSNEIKVVPKYSLGFFKVTKQEQRKIDRDAVAALSSLPGVTALRTEEVLQIPSSLEVSLFGTRFITDSPIYAIEDSTFEQRSSFDLLSGTDTIPVLVSQELVDIYNIGVAAAINRPAINEDILQGFELELNLGTSSFSDEYQGKREQKKARIVGIVENIPIVGITIPQSVLRSVHEEYLPSDTKPLYSRVFLSIAPGEPVERILQSVEDLGFEASSGQQEKMRVQNAFASIELFFYVLVGVILILVVLSFTQFFYGHRSEKTWLLSLLSALGGSPRDLATFFMIQVSYFALLGIIPGVLLGYTLVLVLNTILEYTLQEYLSMQPILTLPFIESTIMIGSLILLLFALTLHPAYLASRAVPEDGVL